LNLRLVDHTLTRIVRKDALAIIRAEGPDNPEVFDPETGA
jgi:nitrite reductase (NO-forming)